ncbi:MAG: hypothetical protein ABI704_31940 [Kofleriaceae bacterium]
MLKRSPSELEALAVQYPGIVEQIAAFEAKELPACAQCQSDNTADVQVGIIGRTMAIAGATTKFHLVPNRPAGRFFCNSCANFFD